MYIIAYRAPFCVRETWRCLLCEKEKQLFSSIFHFKTKSACIRAAKKMAKKLNIEYREVK